MYVTAIAISLFALSMLAIVLNSLCLHIIRKSPSLNGKASLRLIANLLCIHLFEGTIVFPSYAGKRLQSTSLFWARLFNNGFRFSYMISFYGNCLSVLAISTDRFLSVYLLKRYSVIVNMRRVNQFLIVLWIYVIGLSIIPFFDIKQTNESFHYTRDTENNTNITADYRLYYYVQADEWTIFMLCLNCAVPYLLVVLCYVYIISKLKQMEIFEEEYGNKNERFELVNIQGEKVKLKKKVKEILSSKQLTYIALLVAVIYGVCWVPSIIYYLLWNFCKTCFSANYEESTQETYISYIVKYFAFMNAVATPAIYCFRHTEFKNSLNSIVANLGCKVTSETMASDVTRETNLD